MKRLMVFILLSLTITIIYGQTAVTSTANVSLQNQYQHLKSTSQTFKEYKVIPEVSLDGMWAVTYDSLKAKAKETTIALQKITSLKKDLANTITVLKAKEEAGAELAYDSKHISLFGLPFNKGIFITMVISIMGGFTFITVMLFGRLRMMSANVAENKVIVSALTHELEDYKKKSLEKQIKLSRELQNERNRVQELTRMM